MKYTCGVFIENENNEILIGHVTNSLDWSIPKGVVENNETYLDRAIIEVLEETNIDLNLYINGIIKIGEYQYLNKKKTLIAFYIKLNNTKGLDIKCNSMVNSENYIFPEFDELRWVNINKLNSYKLHLTQHLALNSIKGNY